MQKRGQEQTKAVGAVDLPLEGTVPARYNLRMRN
jgi:hypothetical protein